MRCRKFGIKFAKIMTSSLQGIDFLIRHMCDESFYKVFPAPASTTGAIGFSIVRTQRAPPGPNTARGSGNRYRHRGYRIAGSISAVGAPAPFLIDAFSIWNGSIDVTNTHGLSLSLYGQNLFNALGITGGLDPGEAGPPPTNARAAHYFVSRPRTIGLHVGYKF
jgi:outer membrane receptor protein involved in Fe transport